MGKMGIDSLKQVAVLSGLAIATSSLPGMAIDFTAKSSSELMQFKLIQIAQAGDTLCRQTNTVTGIYQQPNIFSVSQGILAAGQTVRLELLGTGTGWSRIREPIVGWVEARFLTPPTPCANFAAQTAVPAPTALTAPANSGSGSAPIADASQPIHSASLPPSSAAQPVAARPPVNQPLPSNFPSPTVPAGQGQVVVPPLDAATQPIPQSNAPQPSLQPNVAVRPTIPPLPAIVSPQTVQNQRAIVTTTCDVLPPEGLAVRRQPDLNTAGAAILAPGTYNFQFTGATQTVGMQRLAYIVAPAEGWIQTLSADGPTLGGGRCG